MYSLSFAVCLLFYLSRRKYFANESKPFAQQMSAPFAPIRNVFTLMLCVLSMWMREREQTFVIPQFRVFKIKSLLIRHVTRSFSATPADIIYVNCCRCELVECKFFFLHFARKPRYICTNIVNVCTCHRSFVCYAVPRPNFIFIGLCSPVF